MSKGKCLGKDKKLILVVDDEHVVRETVRLMLEDLGYNVITANDGEDGVRVYRENAQKISLVLMDMVMPNLNGVEAFYKIVTINPEAKVILASGFSTFDEKIMEHMYVSGLKLFMKKPYLQYELGRALSGVLKN
ncbi:MAG: response regulator [bacterium]